MINQKKINNLRKKLRSKKNCSIGAWIQSGSVVNTEILSNNGFDWITIDMEHSQIDNSKHEDLVRVIQLSGSLPLTRISKPDPNLIKHALDSGSHGVILPMLKNYSQTEKLIKSSIMPPYGDRGVGFFRANLYGKNFSSYKKFAKNPIIIPMIENIDIIKDLDKLTKNKNIDALFIGPYDLSASLGIPGDFKNLKFINIINKIISYCKKNKKAIGIHCISTNKKDLKDVIKKGFNFVAYSTDTVVMSQFLNPYSKLKK